MKITVGVVAYNEEKNLPSLLKDIEGQSYPHSEIEVVLADSMSTRWDAESDGEMAERK